MPVLTVTARGQVTLRKEYLRHFGVKPGDKIDLTLLPEGGERSALHGQPVPGTTSSAAWQVRRTYA